MEKRDLAEMSKVILKYTNPLTYLIVEGTEQIIKANGMNKDSSIEELKNIAAKQEIKLKMKEIQVKLAQELAIAHRIDTAEEVTIEEYYDVNGEGIIGAGFQETSVTLGASGSGRKITKRVYSFKGWREKESEQSLDNKTENSEVASLITEA